MAFHFLFSLRDKERSKKRKKNVMRMYTIFFAFFVILVILFLHVNAQSPEFCIRNNFSMKTNRFSDAAKSIYTTNLNTEENDDMSYLDNDEQIKTKHKLAIAVRNELPLLSKLLQIVQKKCNKIKRSTKHADNKVKETEKGKHAFKNDILKNIEKKNNEDVQKLVSILTEFKRIEKEEHNKFAYSVEKDSIKLNEEKSKMIVPTIQKNNIKKQNENQSQIVFEKNEKITTAQNENTEAKIKRKDKKKKNVFSSDKGEGGGTNPSTAYKSTKKEKEKKKKKKEKIASPPLVNLQSADPSPLPSLADEVKLIEKSVQKKYDEYKGKATAIQSIFLTSLLRNQLTKPLQSLYGVKKHMHDQTIREMKNRLVCLTMALQSKEKFEKTIKRKMIEEITLLVDTLLYTHSVVIEEQKISTLKKQEKKEKEEKGKKGEEKKKKKNNNNNSIDEIISNDDSSTGVEELPYTSRLSQLDFSKAIDNNKIFHLLLEVRSKSIDIIGQMLVYYACGKNSYKKTELREYFYACVAAMADNFESLNDTIEKLVGQFAS